MPFNEYDEFALLAITGGQCAQDDCYLESLDRLHVPTWYAEREKKRISDAIPLTDGRLFLAFRDGMTGVLDARAKAQSLGRLDRVASDQALFERAEVGPGGREVRWGSRCSLAWGELRRAVDSTPLRTDDLAVLASLLVVDASQAALTLGCTRQNVAALARRKRLTPVKAGQRYTLFMRSEVREWAEE